MKLYHIIITALFITLTACIVSYAEPAVQTVNPHFQFVPVVDGTIITHDFIIQNTGNTPLHISRVKTSCGCTTADYTKVIEAHGKGKISIKGNTTGYGGRSFKKTITVTMDDPDRSNLYFYISGEVERFAMIDPRRIFLRGAAGSVLQSSITIVPEKKYPFSITDSYTENLDKTIQYEVQNTNGNYILTATNLQTAQGRYWGRIYLKTDNPVKPEIVIPVSVTIK